MSSSEIADRELYFRRAVGCPAKISFTVSDLWRGRSSSTETSFVDDLRAKIDSSLYQKEVSFFNAGFFITYVDKYCSYWTFVFHTWNFMSEQRRVLSYSLIKSSTWTSPLCYITWYPISCVRTIYLTHIPM